MTFAKSADPLPLPKLKPVLRGRVLKKVRAKPLLVACGWVCILGANQVDVIPGLLELP